MPIVQNTIQPRKNMFKKEVIYVAEELKNSKAIKQDSKDKLIVKVNNVEVDADTVSINYMSSVVALANYKYNQAIANGVSTADAYDATYKSTIGWKNANNTISQVQIESVAEALELAMGAVANIVGV